MHSVVYFICFSKINSDFIVNIEIVFQGKIDYYSMRSQNPILERIAIGFLEGKILILLTGEMWQG